MLATAATIKSHSYSQMIHKLRNDIDVCELACPLFVPLVENGYINAGNEITRLVVADYLNKVKSFNADTIILGCTHYPILLPKINAWCSPGVRIVRQGEYVARSLKDYLFRHPELESRCSRGGGVKYYTTESAEKFSESAWLFLHEHIEVEHINLG